MANETLTFWEHFDELRKTIVDILLAAFLCAFVLFFFKEELFAIVLAPKESTFVTYRIFNRATQCFFQDNASIDFHINLINTQLANQFIIHIKTSFFAAIILVFPYIIHKVFNFISPALYTKERKIIKTLLPTSYFLFLIGIILSYFIIFPLTFNFLGTYQVADEIENIINLDSYIDTFFTLCIMMGVVFETPILTWLLTKMKIISSDLMKKFRRYAVVSITVIAAIITPTADAFTLILVAIPMYFLYETSIFIAKRTELKKK